MCTIETEISLIWGSNWTYTKAIFLATRYLPIPGILSLLYSVCDLLPNERRTNDFRQWVNFLLASHPQLVHAFPKHLLVSRLRYSDQLSWSRNPFSSVLFNSDVLCRVQAILVTFSVVAGLSYLFRYIHDQDVGCLELQSEARFRTVWFGMHGIRVLHDRRLLVH